MLYDGANVWVSNFGTTTITKLNATSGGLIGTYTVGSHPWGLAFDGINVWVANHAAANVTKR